MKKKITIFIILFIIFLVSFIVPVKTSRVWVNDDRISDVGHYEIQHQNIYGITIKAIKE